MILFSFLNKFFKNKDKKAKMWYNLIKKKCKYNIVRKENK